MEDDDMTRTLWTAAACVTLLGGTALAATPADRCESAKNKEAGKYIDCRQKAESKLALTGDGAAYALALQKCVDKYGERWPLHESKAQGACPSANDQAAIQRYLDTASADVAAKLAGGTLADRGHPLKTGQTQCWNSSNSAPIPCAGTGQDGELRKGLDRLHVDNGDGTILDMGTGLVWEKLSDDGSIHDRDNTFHWHDAFAYKVAALNALAFAGHTDWRVPNVNELQSLANYGTGVPAVWPAFNTGCVAACTVLTCSCDWRVGFTSATYWSSSGTASHPPYAWTVAFHDGSVTTFVKGNHLFHVRAVRGGS
jgi:hypothetical protein